MTATGTTRRTTAIRNECVDSHQPSPRAGKMISETGRTRTIQPISAPSSTDSRRRSGRMRVPSHIAPARPHAARMSELRMPVWKMRFGQTATIAAATNPTASLATRPADEVRGTRERDAESHVREFSGELRMAHDFVDDGEKERIPRRKPRAWAVDAVEPRTREIRGGALVPDAVRVLGVRDQQYPPETQRCGQQQDADKRESASAQAHSEVA